MLTPEQVVEVLQDCYPGYVPESQDVLRAREGIMKRCDELNWGPVTYPGPLLRARAEWLAAYLEECVRAGGPDANV